MRPDDEFVLFLPPNATGPIAGKWTATANSHHQQCAGELEMPVTELRDLTEGVDRILIATTEEYSSSA